MVLWASSGRLDSHTTWSSFWGAGHGDRVVLVGDYDESGLWQELPAYRNISRQLVEVWNSFIDLNDRKLTYRPDCGCNTKE